MQIAGALALLFLVLTWIALRSIDAGDRSLDRILVALDRFAMLEAAIDRDALSARAGMLRNYDTMARAGRALGDVTDQLRAMTVDVPDEADVVARLAGLVDQHSGFAEQFKSNNALLQNSLAYFRLFSGQLGKSDDPATVAAVTALDAAMLQLTLDTSDETAQAVADRLERLAALPPDPNPADARLGLIAHGTLLQALLPRTDEVLQALHALPIKDERDRLRTLVLARRDALSEQAQQLRLVLYGFALILLGFLAHLARVLRLRARALRERAAFDHLVASVSMRFLSVPLHLCDAEIEQALGEFAAAFAADRAYLLQVGKSTRLHLWRRNDAPLPPAGWPDQVPALCAALGVADMGFVHVARIGRLPASPQRDTLAAAGLAGWLCMTANDRRGTRRFLGFDALGPGRLTETADVGFARVALDVLANAVTRQGLEEERARLATRLQQARRMETVGAFTSGIAHNFNNLIGAILGYSEMVETDVAFGGRIARNLREIRTAGERARELVSQILAFGRPRHGEQVAVRVDALIAEAASLLRASLPPTVELVVPNETIPAIVMGEGAQLQQVVLNLCNNAAQALTSAGRIGIAVDLHEVADKRVLGHGTLTAGPYVRIAVSDTGRGMSPEVLARIFEPFFTTRRAGHGLGLATVREIVLEHGGGLEVESHPGHGSRFDVWLPQASAAVAAENVPPAPALDRLKTILLIDEDRGRLERHEEILAAIGYEPVGFSRPADALTACRDAPDRFDALILAHTGPAAELTDFSRLLHASAPDLPILLATTSADGVDASALAGAGIVEIVSRPLDPAGVATALRRCLEPSGSRV
ncbi:two-component sensor histidine kinase [Aliidongia dinghuensis]|uniref:histidine kinase n=1 Tax=Aliidongia dinghuensis TaxID=1867774 RepID=A0A8J2YX09_9PROT|nr:two-component system VirA-like sensor kinase [Aliidongia dinghuensis]GGF34544.1 two-component sensor histidine kinase [Aliidongia dinghuensis]